MTFLENATVALDHLHECKWQEVRRDVQAVDDHEWYTKPNFEVADFVYELDGIPSDVSIQFRQILQNTTPASLKQALYFYQGASTQPAIAFAFTTRADQVGKTARVNICHKNTDFCTAYRRFTPMQLTAEGKDLYTSLIANRIKLLAVSGIAAADHNIYETHVDSVVEGPSFPPFMAISDRLDFGP